LASLASRLTQSGTSWQPFVWDEREHVWLDITCARLDPDVPEDADDELT
jgi:hypothetical protein